MKKALYTSTVLAAAGVLAFSATDSQAKAKRMTMSISGNMTYSLGWANQDSAYESTANSTARMKYDAFNIVSDSEVHFRGKTKLDNGVTIDVVIQLEADQSIELERANGGRTVDESYMQLAGGFGRIVLGSATTPNSIMSGGAPGAGAVREGFPTDYWVIRPAAIAMSIWAPGTNAGGNQDVRLIYYTPKFNGFDIGAAYTPSSDDINPMPEVGGNAGDAVQTYDLTAAYNGKVGSTTLRLGAGYVIAQGAAVNSHKTWNVSGRVGFCGYWLGAANRYRDHTDNNSPGAVQKANSSTVWQTRK
jgi:hypothetical protein